MRQNSVSLIAMAAFLKILEKIINPILRHFGLSLTTDYGRRLKVLFILNNDTIYLRTAYEPNETKLRIYDKHGK